MKALRTSFLFAVLLAFLLSVCSASAEGLTHILYSKSLTSTDGTVHIEFMIDEDVDYTALPSYTVTPHYISAEEAQQVAELLFPEGTFYEARPTLDAEYSQAEIQEKLDRWSQYTTTDALLTLFRQAEDQDVEVVEKFIQEYTEKLETASSEAVTVPLEWVFQADELSAGSEEIAGEVISDSLHYAFSATIRQQTDYQISILYAGLSYGNSPLDLDNRIFTAQLCRTEEPTDEQIAAVREKAEALISQLPVGQWEIAECTVKEVKDYGTPEYQICVRAVPVLDGNATLALPQITNLRSTADYASTYYLTDLNIVYSPDGQLMDFSLYSPVDITETSTWNSLVSLDELMEKAAENLSTRSASDGEERQILVQNVEYGLARIKGDSIDNYRYVPAILLTGWYGDYVNGYTEPYYEKENATLVCLNALDGSVIPLGQ